MLNYKSIAIDTETTGLDLYHSCKPFFVTICDCDDNQVYFEWDVNPVNRQPIVPEEDILTLQSIIKEAEQLVFHNAKFDVTALNVLDKRILKHFSWNKVVDTLIADHLLYSNQRRDLTTLGVRYLGINIDKQEIALDKAVLRARLEVRKEDTVLEKRDTILPLEEEELRKAKILFKSNPNKRLAKKILNLELEIKRLKAMKSKFHGWIISEKNLEDNPSINSGARLGKSDMWLPRAIYKILNDNLKKEYQHWDTVLSEYANTDSAITMGVWKIQEHQIERRKLGKIFRERMKLLPITRYIESKGITVNSSKLLQQKLDYIKESEEYKNVCESIAKSYGEEFSDFQMPKSGRSQKLNDFMLSPNGLSLVSNKTSKKTGNPSLDKEALEAIYNELKALEPDSNRTTFIHSLLEKRKRDTAINYMEGYQRFWVETRVKDWYVLHPSLNPTGTDTLRWSSKNPNSQNASRKEGFNLRKSFGPMPDREWYSLDAKNLELRIPAYEAKEQIMIDLFDKPNDPPYFGSNHLVVAHLLYKKEFEECINSDGIIDGRLFKEKYNRTLYHYVKLGNFACVTMDTLALTKEGWKSYNDIKVGDYVVGYNQKTGMNEWTKVVKKMFYKNADVYRIYNNKFSCKCTLNHRWLCSKRVGGTKTRRIIDNLFITTEDINPETIIKTSALLMNSGELNISVDECRFLGLIYGDGHVEINKKKLIKKTNIKYFRVRLFQSKEKGIAYIEKVLKNIPCEIKRYVNKAGITVWAFCRTYCRDLWSRAGIWETRSQIDFEKFVLSLSTEQRLGFIEGMFEAEGWYGGRDKKNKYFAQNAGSIAESIKLGIFLNGGTYHSIVRKPTIHSRSIHLNITELKPYVTGQRLKKEYLGVEDVWCVETELGTWSIKQDDRVMLTGNSQYGAVNKPDGTGTADRAYRVKGGQTKVEKLFTRITELNNHWIKFANKHGYVETIPDKTVDPERGYPLVCPRKNGFISPTIPFNFHIQGTACWWMMKAMIRCHDQLSKWRKEDGFSGFMCIQIHDELVFDFPKSKVDPLKEINTNERKSNLWRIMKIKKLMEKGGDDIGMPIPVSCEYHPVCWSEGNVIC